MRQQLSLVLLATFLLAATTSVQSRKILQTDSARLAFVEAHNSCRKIGIPESMGIAYSPFKWNDQLAAGAAKIAGECRSTWKDRAAANDGLPSGTYAWHIASNVALDLAGKDDAAVRRVESWCGWPIAPIYTLMRFSREVGCALQDCGLQDVSGQQKHMYVVACQYRGSVRVPEPTPAPATPVPATPATPAPAAPKDSAPATPVPTRKRSGLPPMFAAALAQHNLHRAKHGVPALIWSDSVAAAANQYAKQCVFEHDDTSPLGENLAHVGQSWSTKDPAELQAMLTGMIDNWYAEEQDHDYNNPSGSHFTQMVWKASKELGCAFVDCGEHIAMVKEPERYNFMLVCRYTPAGNIRGKYKANVPKPLK